MLKKKKMKMKMKKRKIDYKCFMNYLRNQKANYNNFRKIR